MWRQRDSGRGPRGCEWGDHAARRVGMGSQESRAGCHSTGSGFSSKCKACEQPQGMNQTPRGAATRRGRNKETRVCPEGSP